MHECVFERVWEIVPFENDNICPYQERIKNMEKQKNIVCGADIHKRFIIATLLSRDGNKIRGRFGMTLDEILRFKEWVIIVTRITYDNNLFQTRIIRSNPMQSLNSSKKF